MSDAGESRPRLLVAVAGAALLLAVLGAVLVWDPMEILVGAVELPDVPRWLPWALGKVKFVVIAVITLAVVIRELRRTRGA
jgi:hypothetical protein